MGAGLTPGFIRVKEIGYFLSSLAPSGVGNLATDDYPIFALIRLIFRKRMGEIKIKRAIIKHAAEIGFVKNINMLPPDMSRDCRKEFSSIGPKTNAITKGAGS